MKRIARNKGIRSAAKIKNPDVLYPKLSYEIVGAMIKVWKELGSGFKESIYQKALCEELRSREIPFESQKNFPILYSGKEVGRYIPDFLVDDKILIEIKHLPGLTLNENKQAWYYLKGTQYKLLLLVNFGGSKLEIRRRIYDKARVRNDSQ